MSLSARSRACVAVAALLVSAPLLAISLPKPPAPGNHGTYPGTGNVKVTLKQAGKPVRTLSNRKNLANEVTVNGAGVLASADKPGVYGFTLQAGGILNHTAAKSSGPFIGTAAIAGSPTKMIAYRGNGAMNFKTNSAGKRTVAFNFTGKRVGKPAETVTYTGKGVRN